MPLVFVCPACRHRVSVSRRHAGTDRACPACGGQVHVPVLGDELFLALAVRLGVPSGEVLEHYKQMQQERAARGKDVGLFQLLCDNGVLTLEEESRFRKLATDEPTRESSGAVPVANVESPELGPEPAPGTVGPELRRFAAPAPTPAPAPPAAPRPDAALVNSLAPPALEDALELERQRLDLERQRLDLERQRLDLEVRARELGVAPLAPSPPALVSPPAPGPPPEEPPPDEPRAVAQARRGSTGRIVARRASGRYATHRAESDLEIGRSNRLAKALPVVVGGAAVVGVALGLALRSMRTTGSSPVAAAASPSPASVAPPSPAQPSQPPDAGADGREAAARDAARADFLKKAFAKAAAAEARGDLQGALDALDLAVQAGAPEGLVRDARARLRTRLSDESALRNATAAADRLAASGDFEGALAPLRSVEPAAARLGRADALAGLEAKLAGLAKEKTVLAGVDDLIARSERAYLAGDLETGDALWKKARQVSAMTSRWDPRLGGALLRLSVLAHEAPAGMVFVYVDRAADRGIYVRRLPVTNRDLKRWLDSLPASKARRAPWPRGQIPRGDEDCPVVVPLKDALAFAADAGERLPTAEERAAILRVLGGTANEGEPVGDTQTLLYGFRTVRDVQPPPESGNH